MANDVVRMRVTEEAMTQWAQTVLSECLPGKADYGDVFGAEYFIRKIDDSTFRVETSDGWVAGHFRVLVAVVELP